jgi:succinate dehydrogenase hydrophobic anchor subunit
MVRSQGTPQALTRRGNEGSAFNENAAITSTTAIVSIFLTVFTLFALYTGLQNNVVVVTSQQQSLRVQIQLCLLLPLVVVYFTKVALEDYLRTLFSFNLSTSKT